VRDLYAGLEKLKAQPSTIFTTWRVLEYKIATKAKLARRGIDPTFFGSGLQTAS